MSPVTPKILKLSLILLLFSGMSSPLLSAQTRDQLKQQAEEQLKKLTPEEVEAKLKEYGISRWEAIRRAQDIGLTLEDYLGRTTMEDGVIQYPTAGMDTVQALPKPIRKPIAKPKEPLVVLGFTGRAGIDTTIVPFGYDLFEFPESTFEPPLNVSTPSGYLLGPGDELTLSLWGETKLYYQLAVNRDGNVLVPDVGPVSANGQTIQQFRGALLRRMTSVYSGLANGSPNANTFLDVSLGKLRSIQVYVVGEVKRPGGYVLSSVSTVLQALYLAGGPTVNGSLRHISVSRSGQKPQVVDTYNYLLIGDRSKDLRLDDGDVVFVTAAKNRAAIVGNVVRPGIYELGDKGTVRELVELSGGPRFNTDLRRIHIERIIPFEKRKDFQGDVLDLDLNLDTFEAFQKNTTPIVDGDIVSLFRIADLPQNRVFLTGHVRKPGPFEFKPGMRISDLIMAADSLRRGTFMDRGLLLRMLPNLRRETIPFEPRLALTRDQGHDLLLQNEDSLVVYSEKDFLPVGKVAISGAVRKPDYYPRHENMSLHELVVMAGGLTESAELTGWEISRLDTSALGVYARVIKIQTPFSYTPDADDTTLHLKDFDYVFVPSDPKFQVQKFIDLQGYVMYPGPYPIRFEGERLADVIGRAGGLRPGAYLEGSRFFRRGAVGDKILIGQIPIDFRGALADPNSRDNIVLYERDSIYISYFEDVVRVAGEVFVPSAILYKKGEDMDYYIDQAGGTTDEADEGRIYAFLPGGKKYESGELLPGSSVFVPKKIEKEDKTLPIIRDLATILASLAAITVALVQVTR